MHHASACAADCPAGAIAVLSPKLQAQAEAYQFALFEIRDAVREANASHSLPALSEGDLVAAL